MDILMLITIGYQDNHFMRHFSLSPAMSSYPIGTVRCFEVSVSGIATRETSLKVKQLVSHCR